VGVIYLTDVLTVYSNWENSKNPKDLTKLPEIANLEWYEWIEQSAIISIDWPPITCNLQLVVENCKLIKVEINN